MSPEKLVPNSRDIPSFFLRGILDDANIGSILLKSEDSPEKNHILTNIRLRIRKFNYEDQGKLLTSIIDGLGSTEDYWTQDKRDILIEVLSEVDMGFLDDRNELRKSVLDHYLQAVSTQNNQISDPYGNIYSLIEGGRIILDDIEPIPGYGRIKRKVSDAWTQVSEQFEGDERLFIQNEASKIIDAIEEKNKREIPPFKPNEKELHDKYLEVTKKQKTFKLALWENAPEFVSLVRSIGINIERFWNLADPDSVVQGLEKLKARDPLTLTQLSNFFSRKIGIELQDLSNERSRVIADEIIETVVEYKDNLTNSIIDPQNIIERFRKLLEGFDQRSRKAQKSLISQIVGFFKTYGIKVSYHDKEKVLDALKDSKKVAEVKNRINVLNSMKQEQIGVLADAFDLNIHPNFQLISRTRGDLFLGDLTGDCTAYHLDAGVNAETVPAWLSNPGFNIFTIKDKDEFIAKLGVILGTSNEQPVLVVDSIEVGSRIEDEERAKELIHSGLKFLKDWAINIGLSQVFMNTFSNSRDLVDYLDTSKITESSKNQDLKVLGGLSGLTELRKNLIGKEIDEKIYLQSIQKDEADAELPNDAEIFLRDFEKKMVGVIERLGSTQDKEKFNNDLKTSKWNEVFKSLMNINFPYIVEVLGGEWETYRKFIDVIKSEIGSSATFQPDGGLASSELKNIVDEYWLPKILLEHDEELENAVIDQIGDVEEFLLLVKDMETVGLTPELALNKLYGESQDTEKILRLRSNLPLLTI